MKIPSSVKNIIYGALAFLFLISFFIFSHSFSNDYKRLRNNGAFQYGKQQLYIHGGQQPPTQSIVPPQVDSIGEWMTFAYINKIFNLQNSYLKSNLNIVDVKYPNITLSKAASEAKIDEAIYLVSVKDLVNRYTSTTSQ